VTPCSFCAFPPAYPICAIRRLYRSCTPGPGIIYVATHILCSCYCPSTVTLTFLLSSLPFPVPSPVSFPLFITLRAVSPLSAPTLFLRSYEELFLADAVLPPCFRCHRLFLSIPFLPICLARHPNTPPNTFIFFSAAPLLFLIFHSPFFSHNFSHHPRALSPPPPWTTTYPRWSIPTLFFPEPMYPLVRPWYSISQRTVAPKILFLRCIRLAPLPYHDSSHSHLPQVPIFFPLFFCHPHPTAFHFLFPDLLGSGFRRFESLFRSPPLAHVQHAFYTSQLSFNSCMDRARPTEFRHCECSIVFPKKHRRALQRAGHHGRFRPCSPAHGADDPECLLVILRSFFFLAQFLSPPVFSLFCADAHGTKLLWQPGSFGKDS